MGIRRRAALLLLAALSAIPAMATGAKTWTSDFTLGSVQPIARLSVDGSCADDVQMDGIGIAASYVGYHAGGFAVKGAVAFGAALSDTLDAEANGTFFTASLGAGYAFVRNGRFSLATTGGMGIETASFEDATPRGHFAADLVFVTVSAGAALTGVLRLSDHFGLFAAVDAQYPFWGKTYNSRFGEQEARAKNYRARDYHYVSLHGRYIVQPALGVAWVF